MTVFLITVGFVGLAMGAMALASRLRGRSLRGSCGGVGADCLCEATGRTECPDPPEFMKRLLAQRNSSDKSKASSEDFAD